MSKTPSAEQFIENKIKEFEKKKLKGKKTGFKDISRKGTHYFLKEAWTFMPQSTLPDKKVFVIERLRRREVVGENSYKDSLKHDDIEYRIGYYIVGAIGNKKGKWTWGQYCPLIPIKDLDKLLKQAKREKTLI